jgi:poly(A) polymerase
MAQGTEAHIELPQEVTAVARRFTEAGGELYVVGGWLRDVLRGAACKDVDMATDLSPARVKQLLDPLGPIYTMGEKFGTIGLRLDDYAIEITSFRSDTYTPGSRHPEIEPAGDIAADLARRDFTINAMALRVAPEPGTLVDPFDGSSDLDRGLIRTPGPPEPRMAEDPLRMMRAVRFAAQLGFAIDTDLLAVLSGRAEMLDGISCERRRDELEKILVSPHPDQGVSLLVDTGLMEYVLPEVAAMKDVNQPPDYHRADVLVHTLLTMACLEPDPLLRRSALLHDVGKPPTRVTEPKVMFPDHDKVGAELTRTAMKRLRYGNEDISRTVFMVRRHMRPIHYQRTWSDSAVRRLVRDCTLEKDGAVMVPLADVIALARADIKAGNLEKATIFLGLADELEERIETLGAHEEVVRAHSPLDGTELSEMFGREPGPWIRPLKEHLAQMVVDGSLAQDDKEAASEAAREFMRSRPSP